jgi:hypothetical protein
MVVSNLVVHDNNPASSFAEGWSLLDPGRLGTFGVLKATIRAELRVNSSSICGSGVGEFREIGRLKERRDKGLGSGVADMARPLDDR